MKLLEPCTIGSMEIKNRFVMAPMSLNLNKDGFVTDSMVRFYEERAKGGAGLITIGDGIVDSPIGNNVIESTPLDDDMYIPALRKLTQAVHEHGSKIAMQLSHGGRRAGRAAKDGYLKVTRGKIPVAPSALPHPVPGQVVPRELTKEEIKELVVKFGEAARRAVDAGFDAIGLHCAHMYLCGEFLTPWANQRTDEYGGDFEGRLRFVLEVIDEIKKKTGPQHPLIIRMNGREPEGGNTLEEIREIARRFQEAGADAIHVSVGFGAPTKDPGLIPSITPMRAPHGIIVHLAENIKKGVSIPVITVNKLGNVSYAETILQEGRADLIGLGRPLIADPMLPKKVMEGRSNDIRPCICCCRGCLQNVLEKNIPVACSVNAEAGHEMEKSNIKPAEIRKKVLVLGGGPAGMQTALIASQRGHEVLLVERGSELGGQLLLASLPPGKQDILPFTNYLVNQIKKSNVEVKTSTEILPEWLKENRPDIAVLATGSIPVMPEIPGLESRQAVSARMVLEGVELPGQDIVVIGGGQVGCETAELLAEQGKNIVIVEMLEGICKELDHINRIPLELALESHGVRILTKSKPLEITEEGVRVQHMGNEEFLPASHVVIATGAKPAFDDVEDVIRQEVSDIFVIGDKSAPQGILEAVRDGFDMGGSI
ncbi:MAG: FAD-dependent oxidoreductase [Desulfobacteraceae bacterium]|nr:FAD-dependent oxidoreductase [Desulfobacteraceae bacterium]